MRSEKLRRIVYRSSGAREGAHGASLWLLFFPTKSAPIMEIALLPSLAREGMTIFRSVVLCKNKQGQISALGRVEAGKKIGVVTALLGALAGFPGGLEAAGAGALGGLLFGMSAELTNRDTGNRIVQKVLNDLRLDTCALFAEISSDHLTFFEARMTELGATILHPLAA